MDITNEWVEFLDNSRDGYQALSKLGTVSQALYGTGANSHVVADEYIKAKRGSRATGGFFVWTRDNLMNKFFRVWNEENKK